MPVVTATHDYRGSQLNAALPGEPERNIEAELSAIGRGEAVNLHLQAGDRFRLREDMRWGHVVLREGAIIYVLHKIFGGKWAFHVLIPPGIAMQTQRDGVWSWTAKELHSDKWERMP